MIGTTLGHYRIVAKLGQGGMGEVFEAEDERLKRRVALKLLSSGVGEGREQRERFQREAETIASLNHPNIVTLYSIEQIESRQFLTMEKIEGEGLDQVLAGGGLPLERIFDIAIPMADALSAAHARDVVHRDLKPANVMLTPEGRVKVLDFGLAKLVAEPTAGIDEATALLTQDGMVLGTVPYMSPEQVQGKEVDRRSDIFSLGVILYEMATGSRPFSGQNSAELISSILRDQPPTVTEIDARLPHHLGRIVRHCLEKDPARRYQSALDVRNELEALQKEVDSGIVHSETVGLPAATAGRTGRRRTLAGLTAMVAVAGLAAVAGWRLLAPAAPRPVAAPGIAGEGSPSTQSSVAVLFFDNLSGEAELDWLRNGLTDMLVTDLSQSPEVRVLSTDRVYQILSDLNKLDERITSFEVVREVAEQADADTVILGSYAKLGDTIQISIRIQEAATGEILQADTVRATGQEEIFARIDDLSRNIRRSMELPDEPATVTDRGVAEVTTDSVAAYRYFVEAENLHFQSKDQEAIELYRKAVETDPEFALAWAKLGTAHSNVGMQAEATLYTEKAIEHVDRLTAPERAYVEGRYYGGRIDTLDRAVAIYTGALDRYPHLTAIANNLAILYNSLWMHEQAIATFEQGIAHGDTFPGTYTGLASAYVATGNAEKAVATLEGFLERQPESFTVLTSLAAVHGALGHIEEAKATLDRAEEIRPGFIGTIMGRFAFGVATDDFELAREQIQTLQALPFPFAHSAAMGLETVLLLYAGQMAEALALGEQSVASASGSGAGRARSRLGLAAGYLALERPDKALEHLRGAREDDEGTQIGLVAHGLEVLAHQMSGASDRADEVLADYKVRAAAVPGNIFASFTHEVSGNLLWMRDDHTAALDELRRAEALLPDYSEDAARIWLTLGEVHLEVDQKVEAERMFRRIVDLGVGRVFRPAEFVFSHYRLGRILEERGDSDRARELYRKFLGYWAEGDVEREAVEHAQRFLAGGSES